MSKFNPALFYKDFLSLDNDSVIFELTNNIYYIKINNNIIVEFCTYSTSGEYFKVIKSTDFNYIDDWLFKHIELNVYDISMLGEFL